MVSPILIGAVILTVVVGGFYGGKEIFRLEGTNKTVIDVIPKEEKRLPQNFTDDLGEIAKSFPTGEVVESGKNSIGGIAKFFTKIITTIVNWVYGFFRPGKVLPTSVGLLTFFFVVILILWRTVGTMYEWAYELLKYLLILSGLGLGVFLVLLFLNVI